MANRGAREPLRVDQAERRVRRRAVDGAGIAIEDGTETENLFEENFVVYILGSINP
ncbi:MAG TPA: hypothetical protein VH701_11170 [Vicinamibacterales bacterium]